jgi:hypothetical protein
LEDARLLDRSTYLLVGVAVMLLFVAHVVSSQNSAAVSKHAVLPLDDDAWRAGPEGMPAGVRFAAITGDPAQPGPFVLRAELPPGYSISPYRRSSDESIVVLAGELRIGDGSAFDRSRMRNFGSGAFVRLRADDPHYATTDGGAVVQIMGTGPFAIEYVRNYDVELPAPAREKALSARQ